MSNNFFDFREQLTTPRAVPPARGPATAPMSVSDLTRMIDGALRAGLPGHVLVQGEISNFTHHRGSGHFYFTMKDSRSCIDCVMFRSDATRIRFDPQDGMELIAGGQIQVYAAKGRYQLYVRSLQPVGRGALELAFQQLHAKLQAEGLFAPERKRPIPKYPRRIALVTGRETAALHDILKVLRRYSWIRVALYDVAVQGDGAGRQVTEAIEHLSEQAQKFELIVLARGGGSLEDLWAFNEEIVARSIARSRLPIVTGIGHEVDRTIVDLVADYHAHTPTEAAQIVCAHWKSAPEWIEAARARMQRSMLARVGEGRQQLLHAERHAIFRRPADRINALRQVLDDRQRVLVVALSRRLRVNQSRLERISSRLEQSHPRLRLSLLRQQLQTTATGMRASINRLGQHRSLRLDAMAGQLEALSPQRVLARGYSITMHKKKNSPVRSAAELKAGERIITRFVDGTVESTVDDANQPRLFE